MYYFIWSANLKTTSYCFLESDMFNYSKLTSSENRGLSISVFVNYVSFAYRKTIIRITLNLIYLVLRNMRCLQFVSPQEERYQSFTAQLIHQFGITLALLLLHQVLCYHLIFAPLFMDVHEAIQVVYRELVL